MRVTVIFEDNKVGVNADFREVSMPSHDSNWSVIQWYDDNHGTIEVYLGDRIWFTDFSIVQPYYDAWVAAAPQP